MSRTPLQFDYGSRSNSSPIPFSEPPNYSNYTGYFAPLLAPHAKFPIVKGFVPNFCLSATAAVPYSATPSVATSEIGPSQDLQNRELANGAKNTPKWSDDQTLVLVQEWKDRVEDVESSRSVEAWNKIVTAVNKAGTEKTLQQCKDKIRNLKQACKDAKTNNLKTSRETKSNPYFDVFDQVLGSRPVVRMPGVVQSTQSRK